VRQRLGSAKPLTLPTLPYLTLPYQVRTCVNASEILNRLPYLTLPYLTLPYLTLPYQVRTCVNASDLLPAISRFEVLCQQVRQAAGHA